jgi:PTS system nitrogen regulatory IIA component
MKLKDFLITEKVVPELRAASKKEVLIELSQALRNPDSDRFQQQILEALEERECLGSTGVGEGVAIPHAKIRGLPRIQMAFGRSRHGIDFEAIDQSPVFLFFALIAPDNSQGLHIQLLAHISRLLQDPIRRRKLLAARDREEIYRLLTEEDEPQEG